MSDGVSLRARSWFWLRGRVEALLMVPPTYLPDGRPVEQTRLGHVLFPPPDRG